MPPPQDAIRTPDRKSSSSALLGTFRSLVTRRSQSYNSSSPIPANLSSTDSVARSGSTGVDLKNVGTEVVAPAELTQQLEFLSPQYGLGTRTAAAHKICTLLDEYPVRNIAAVWEAAQDLLDESNAPTGPTAGYALLLALAKSPDITPLERRLILEAIQKSRKDLRLDERFRILRQLTNNGRDVDAIESSLGDLLHFFLKNTYEAVVEARRKNKVKSEVSAKEELLCGQAFRLIVDITKFNSRVLTKGDITAIVDQVIAICKRTNVQTDISNSILVMDALVTYNTVPDRPLRSWLELLADIYRQLENLHSQAWAALANVFKSHLGHTATSVLLLALRCQDSKKEPDRNVVRGAFHVLGDLVRENGKEGLPRLSLSVFIPAVKESLAIDRRKHDADVLLFIADLQACESLRKAILDENLVSDVSEIILQCAERSSPKRNGGSGASGVEDTTSTSSLHSDDAEARQRVRHALDRILETINDRFGVFDLIQKSILAQMMLRICHRLSDSAIETLLEYIAVERLLFPSDSKWESNCKTLIRTVLRDPSRTTSTRIHVFEALKDSFLAVDSVRTDDSANPLIDSILQSVPREKDTDLLQRIVDLAVQSADHTSSDRFELLTAKFTSGIFKQTEGAKSRSDSIVSAASQCSGEEVVKPSTSAVLVKGLVRMFMRNLNRDRQKTLSLYQLLLRIASTECVSTDARIAAFKLLFKLRADSSSAPYIFSGYDVEPLVRVLGRTSEGARERQPEPSPLQRRVSTDKVSLSRDGQRRSTMLPLTSSKELPVAQTKFGPKLWFYPDADGLPDEIPPRASALIRVGSNCARDGDEPASAMLDISKWLEIAVSILVHHPNWELYSFVLVHLGVQISNKTLFRESAPQIQLLRSVICEQIRNKSFMEPPPDNGLKKGDVAACLFHILTNLLAYHEHFSKNEEDDIVRTFISGIGSWDRTAKWCIHSMSICCQELPLSMSKALDTIIQKMSQIITRQQVAVHILEFLAGLARMPELYKNFREDEYRMVFGVCFRYLQYVRDQQGKEKSRAGPTGGRLSGSSKDLVASAEREQAHPRKVRPQDLPQYVYVKTFHVITFWFMALKMQDRVRYMNWIARNLTYTDDSGQPVVEDQGIVTIDMMQRIAFSDREETQPNPHFASLADGHVSVKTWLTGLSVLTIETAGRTGLSQITRRRPTGNRYSIYRPQVIDPPRHQVPLTTGLAADVFYTSDYVGVLPDDILQEFYSPLSIAGSVEQSDLVQLPDDEATRRAISSLDRIPVLDSHKVGLIYIGPGQTEEKDILANTSGSAAYTEFGHRLGTLIKLKGSKLNTQGLDREFDTDGEHAILWRDRASEIVFHATTLMPTNLENDPHCVNKKRHIGNDFVNIVWNASGQPFNFDTFPSAFNYVYIVIEPEARPSVLGVSSGTTLFSTGAPTSPIDASGNAAAVPPTPMPFYKIQVVSAPSFPRISPAADPKLVSGKSLPSLARLLALNASVFSLVWSNREHGEYASSWRARLQQIRALREKFGAGTAASAAGAGAAVAAGFANATAPLGTAQTSALESALSSAVTSPVGRERGGDAGGEAGMWRRSSTFFSEGAVNRGSGDGSGSVERGDA